MSATDGCDAQGAAAAAPFARLKGVRVLDLTNVLAGPFCGHQLAHLGADVIKVEAPGGGDLARQLGADGDLNAAKMGVSFLAQNAGKRSIAIDLKHPQGKAVFQRLVANADVVLENFRPGVMDRLDLGYATLKAINPRLVYCAISGFGQTGPLSRSPAYDQIVQGYSGTMSITGAPDTAPYRVGYPVADTIGGLTAAFAIAAALNNRERDGGCFIDVAMLDSVLATMGWVVSNHLIAGRDPEPLGNENFTAAPSGTFETGGGLINIAANKQAQFIALCGVIGRPDLVDDPRFAARAERLAHRFALKAEIEQALQSATADVWCERLTAVGVPAGPVLTVPAALAHPQVAHRDLIETFDQVAGVDRPVRVVRTGFHVDGRPTAVDMGPRALGADTRTVLCELGYGGAEIDALAADGAVFWGDQKHDV